MKKHHILLDYENVQPRSLPSLDREDVYLTLFLGPNQPRVPVELVMGVQPMGSRASYVRLATGGNNALDFVIAFTAGEIVAADAKASLYIVSRDKGFDPLVEHLWARKVDAQRHASLDTLPVLNTPQKQAAQSLEDRVQAVKNYFQKPGVTKPRTLKTLKNAFDSFFKKALKDDELDALIKELGRRKLIAVTENKVEHAWPADPVTKSAPTA